MGKNIGTCSSVFGFFGGFLDYFLTYAGSVSFRELKNAIKKYFFLNLGGVGAKTRFLSKKNWGRILGLAGKNIGSARLIYMGGRNASLPNFRGNMQPVCFRQASL